MHMHTHARMHVHTHIHTPAHMVCLSPTLFCCSALQFDLQKPYTQTYVVTSQLYQLSELYHDVRGGVCGVKWNMAQCFHSVTYRFPLQFRFELSEKQSRIIEYMSVFRVATA